MRRTSGSAGRPAATTPCSCGASSGAKGTRGRRARSASGWPGGGRRRGAPGSGPAVRRPWQATGWAGPPLATDRGYFRPARTTWLLLREPAALADDEWAYVAPPPTDLSRPGPAPGAGEPLPRSGAGARRGRARAVAGGRRPRARSPSSAGSPTGCGPTARRVEAGLTLPWSQGQVEGQVNRLKLLKRAGFGRQSLDLLRLRMLRAA